MGNEGKRQRAGPRWLAGTFRAWLGDRATTKRRVVGVVLGMGLPLACLAWIDGSLWKPGVGFALLADPVPIVRIFLAVPLLMFLEPQLDRVLQGLLEHLRDSPILRREGVEELDRNAERFREVSASKSTDKVLVVVALVAAYLIQSLAEGRQDGTWMVQGDALTLAGWWYVVLVMAPYLFLVLRAVLRYLTWCVFVVRFSRLPLRLNPIHPDRAGGLGILGTAHLGFVALFFVLVSVVSAVLAASMLVGLETFASIRVSALGFVLFSLLALVGPLLFLTPTLLRARVRGLAEQGAVADELFDAFDEKWVGEGRERERELLGDVDPSSLADYAACYDMAREMSLLPVTLRSVGVAIAILAAPFLPLLLLEFPIQELLQRLVDIVA